MPQHSVFVPFIQISEAEQKRNIPGLEQAVLKGLVCAILEMRPNEKAWGGSVQSYVNAPFVDPGANSTANTEPHAGLSSHFYTHLKSGSLYLHIQ